MTNTKKSNGRNTAKGRRIKNTEQTSPALQIFRVGALSVLFSMSAAFLFMIIITAIIFKTQDPCAMIKPISLSLLYFTAIFCGFLSGRMYRGAPMLSGSVSGLIFILTILAVSIFLKPEIQSLSPGIKAILFLAIIPAVFVGSFLGNIKIVKKRKSPYKRR